MKTRSPNTAIDRMFRALSDRTRLRILALLQGGELCVCDIVSALKVPQPTASRHLAYLRKAGLVSARKEGQWHYYRLQRPTFESHVRLLECVASCCHELADIKRDSERLKKCCQPNSCCE